MPGSYTYGTCHGTLCFLQLLVKLSYATHGSLVMIVNAIYGSVAMAGRTTSGSLFMRVVLQMASYIRYVMVLMTF